MRCANRNASTPCETNWKLPITKALSYVSWNQTLRSRRSLVTGYEASHLGLLCVVYDTALDIRETENECTFVSGHGEPSAIRPYACGLHDNRSDRLYTSGAHYCSCATSSGY